jgi:hypothetical protein
LKKRRRSWEKGGFTEKAENLGIEQLQRKGGDIAEKLGREQF